MTIESIEPFEGPFGPDHKQQVVECDTCGEIIERGCDCLHHEEWIAALKDAGWAFYPHDRHECPQCAVAMKSPTD